MDIQDWKVGNASNAVKIKNMVMYADFLDISSAVNVKINGLARMRGKLNLSYVGDAAMNNTHIKKIN